MTAQAPQEHPGASLLPDGTPHPDQFLAARGWQVRRGIYVRVKRKYGAGEGPAFGTPDEAARCTVCHRANHRPGTYQGHPFTPPEKS
jgi:hypothetical protein